jgi:thiamine transport system ATP-binding protein
MFQDGVLFPHLSVLDNVAYGLRMRGVARAERDQRAQALLTLVGLDPDGFGARPVDLLSGGEQQRVALARALAPEPEVLLLDEPFASLDAVLRGRLVDDVRAVCERLGTTVVAVTHDRGEAFAFADRIAVMERGRVVQFDRPDRLLSAPCSPLAARLLGLAVIPAAVLPRRGDDEWVAVRPGGARTLAVTDRGTDAIAADLVTGTVLSSVTGGSALQVVVVLDGPGPEADRRIVVDASFDAPHLVGDRIQVAVRHDAQVRLPGAGD